MSWFLNVEVQAEMGKQNEGREVEALLPGFEARIGYLINSSSRYGIFRRTKLATSISDDNASGVP